MDKICGVSDISTALAEVLHRELASREIEVLPAHTESFEKTPNYNYWGVGIRLNDNSNLYQACLATPYNTKWRSQESLIDMVLPWAKELAIKLARPFPIKFYKMELPQNVHEVAEGSYRGVLVRMVTDYSIQTDQLVTRFDCVVEWMEN